LCWVYLFGLLKKGNQLLIVGKRNTVQPPVLLGNRSDKGAFKPSHQFSLGNGPVALSLAHAVNNLSILIHLKSPVSHGKPSWKMVFQKGYQIIDKVRDAFFNFADTEIGFDGSITPITKWPHYGDHKLARLRRPSGGLIAPITRWHDCGDHWMAL
jgi:hypothetical protein